MTFPFVTFPFQLTNVFTIQQRYQSLLDAWTPYTAGRWIGTFILIFSYMARVIILQGWYIVTYALGIYYLNLFIAFLTPRIDPSFEEDAGKIFLRIQWQHSPDSLFQMTVHLFRHRMTKSSDHSSEDFLSSSFGIQSLKQLWLPCSVHSSRSSTSLFSGQFSFFTLSLSLASQWRDRLRYVTTMRMSKHVNWCIYLWTSLSLLQWLISTWSSIGTYHGLEGRLNTLAERILAKLSIASEVIVNIKVTSFQSFIGYLDPFLLPVDLFHMSLPSCFEMTCSERNVSIKCYLSCLILLATVYLRRICKDIQVITTAGLHVSRPLSTKCRNTGFVNKIQSHFIAPTDILYIFNA